MKGRPNMKEYNFGYAIVRIHDGKRSEEERIAHFKKSAEEFYHAILKANPNAKIPCETVSK